MLRNPWFWFGVYYLFSSVVSGMPAPDEKSGTGYRWAYTSLHIMAGNARTALTGAMTGKLPPA